MGRNDGGRDIETKPEAFTVGMRAASEGTEQILTQFIRDSGAAICDGNSRALGVACRGDTYAGGGCGVARGI